VTLFLSTSCSRLGAQPIATCLLSPAALATLDGPSFACLSHSIRCHVISFTKENLEANAFCAIDAQP
jgi:hypothetical protein